MHDAWFCPFPKCEATYFNQYNVVVSVDELVRPVYPKDPDAPICACFGLCYDDVAADVAEGLPTRVRDLLAKTKTSAAKCATLAADGRCCDGAVQELYLRLKAGGQATR